MVGDIDEQIAASQALIAHHRPKLSDKWLLLQEGRGKPVYVQVAEPLLTD